MLKHVVEDAHGNSGFSDRPPPLPAEVDRPQVEPVDPIRRIQCRSGRVRHPERRDFGSVCAIRARSPLHRRVEGSLQTGIYPTPDGGFAPCGRRQKGLSPPAAPANTSGPRLRPHRLNRGRLDFGRQQLGPDRTAHHPLRPRVGMASQKGSSRMIRERPGIMFDRRTQQSPSGSVSALGDRVWMGYPG